LNGTVGTDVFGSVDLRDVHRGAMSLVSQPFLTTEEPGPWLVYAVRICLPLWIADPFEKISE
jgi:hypothetical protein